jgi:tripartite-type tricarboxylate transporter receptor subunit TctC
MPASSLKLVLGFSRGSASHEAAASVTPALERETGRKVEFVWQPGESGARAARLVAESPPDGGTLLLATLGTHGILPIIRTDCGYDPIADFAPVALLTRAPLVLGVHPGLGVRTVRALIERARTAVPPLSFGSSAEGGAPHLAGAMFAAAAGLMLDHTVYDDTRQLYADLTAGRIPLSFNNVASMRPLLESGALLGLGVTGATRLPEFPALPTIAESGFPDYDLTNWVALLAPAGTPPETLAALSHAVGARAPEQLSALMRAERDTLRGIVERLGWAQKAS